MERHDMMQEWLAKSIRKIDTMSHEELLEAMERYGLIEPKDEENIDETTKAD